MFSGIPIYLNKNSILRKTEIENRMKEIKKLMKEYIKNLADHPRISFSGMLYYSQLNSEYNKLNEEYKKYNNNENVDTDEENEDIIDGKPLRRSKRLQEKNSC